MPLFNCQSTVIAWVISSSLYKEQLVIDLLDHSAHASRHMFVSRESRRQTEKLILERMSQCGDHTEILSGLARIFVKQKPAKGGLKMTFFYLISST